MGEIFIFDFGSVGYEMRCNRSMGSVRIYRNARTKELDKKYNLALQSEQSQPIVSCFDGGNHILVPLRRCAAKIGFHFGVELGNPSPIVKGYVEECVSEDTVKIVNYMERDIIMPIEFK